MAWNPDILTQGEIHALREAAERAWGDDTRHEAFSGAPLYAGQCYNTSRWLQERLGGSVGVKDGHYFWVSPDHSYALDLTADQFGGHPMLYKSTSHHLFDGFTEAENLDDEDTRRFINRANREFAELGSTISKVALDYAGDAYPAEMPQKANDLAEDSPYYHRPPAHELSKGEYYFIFANGRLEASPFHDHRELAKQAEIDLDSTGPLAVGFISVDTGIAHWSVQSNIGAKALSKELKDYTKRVGWQWGGMTNLDGEPIGAGSEFAPSKTARRGWFRYVPHNDKLYIGKRDYDLVKQALTEVEDDVHVAQSVYGTFEENDKLLRVTRVNIGPKFFLSTHRPALANLISALKEYGEDRGLTLVSGLPGDGWADAKGGVGDNVIKRIEDLELDNLYDPNPKEEDGQFFPKVDQREPGGVYKCPQCGVLRPTWRAYVQHIREHEDLSEEPRQDGGFPEVEMEREKMGIPSDYVPQQPEIMPVAKLASDGDPAGSTERDYICANGHLIPAGTEMYEISSFGQEPKVRVPCRDCGIWYTPDQLHTDAFSTQVSPPPLPRTPPQIQRHPDPWMDNEPGTLTLPEHWGGIVMPVASVKEARRVDGFRTYAKAFDFDDDGHRHYVAFRAGCPVGFATISPEGILKCCHVNEPVTHHIMNRVRRDYDELVVEGGSLSESWLRHAQFYEVAQDKWRYAKGKTPTDMLEAEVPFIFDIKDDTVVVGQPGQKTSDIMGPFTPGGIVEGIYEPGGKVYLNTETNMPYSIRHLIELWYWQHPELEVKSVIKRDGQGNEIKLAQTDVGTEIRTLVAADPAASSAARALMQAGGNVYAVGGAVRDVVMGKDPKDIDLLVQGLPADEVENALKQLPGRVDYTGKDFGVFRLRLDGDDVEVALPRRERSTGDAHKDFEVQSDHTMSVEEDLYRRDFTANAMAVDLASGELIDPFGGAEDIENGVLRTVHENALAEDPLRTIRALVSHGRHGLTPDEATRAQMAAYGDRLGQLPAERIQAELDKIMSSPDPAAAVRLAHETGLLAHLLPEVDAAMGYDQNNPHHEQDLGEHLLSVLDRVAQINDDPDVRLAALLHDVGKPESAWVDPETGFNHFYRSPEGEGHNHEELGAEMVRKRLEELRFPKDRVKRISDLVLHHMFPWWTTDKGARRFVNRVGDYAEALMDLREADNGGKTAIYDDRGNLPTIEAQREMLRKLREQNQPFNRTQLAINGHDLTALGFQGPQIGEQLARLTELVIDDPSLNERETLLSLLQDDAALT